MDAINWNNVNVGSLFSGIGGIDLGFQQAGFNIRWANEIDKNACYTYSLNFKNHAICNDIKTFKKGDIENVDVITAGFPCQAFSIAGNRGGFKDSRGILFFDIIEIVKHLIPKVIFLENVKNLKFHNKGETFREIITALKEVGYNVVYKVLNTYEYSNIPQNRERLYIVCFKNRNSSARFLFPKKVETRLVVRDLIEPEVDEKFYYKNTRLYEKLKGQILYGDIVYQWRRTYIRGNKNNLCPTLTASMGTGGHNVPIIHDRKDVRKITPRECARFQGFKDSFILPSNLLNSVLYKQIGNSVSVPVIESIAKEIFKVL